MDIKTELIASQLCIPPKIEFTWGTREQKNATVEMLCVSWSPEEKI